MTRDNLIRLKDLAHQAADLVRKEGLDPKQAKQVLGDTFDERVK